MNPAVSRLLDEREDQGLSRHVEDEPALAQVAQLLNANDGRSKQAPVAVETTTTTGTGCHGKSS
jgi:hypothetical protein